jgi:uncharacterized membrane protein
MKDWYKSKTIWIAIIQAIIGVLVVIETQYPGVGFIVLFKSVLDTFLRVATYTELDV